MSTATQVIWTALPNGLDASYYYFSVFVSHRLSGGPTGTLADYPLGPTGDPTNWASSMLPATMQVSFGAGFITAQLVPPGYPGFWAPIAPNLWSQIFPSSTPVEDYAAQVLPQVPSTRAIRTYNATALVTGYEGLYATLATSSGGDFPSVTAPSVTDYVTALGRFPALLANLARLHPQGTPPHSDPKNPNSASGPAQLLMDIQNFFGGPSNAAQIAFEHYLAYRFYRRNTGSQYGTRSGVAPAALTAPSPSFHKLVGMLADHPTLLRNLGLCLDYRISIGNTGAAPPPPVGAIQVNASWGAPATVTNVYPQTLYRIVSSGSAAGFYAMESSSPTDILNGMLVLAPGNNFSVAQMDPDGHAQKMIAYGITAAEVQFTTGGLSSPTTPSGTQSLPARRTGGLTVLKSGRADSLTTLFGRGDTNNGNLAASNPITLDSSDVCRGFRVDVWDASSNTAAGGLVWRSLCQRGGTDVVAGTPYTLAPADIEGFVKAAGATRGDPTSDATEQNTLYVHEAVFGWDGWSLVARRPGRAIAYSEGDGKQNPVVIGFLPNHAAPGYPVVSNYSVTPGTLPRLRFGRRYQFRARAVDLAGNSLPLGFQGGTVDPSTASAAAAFLRYEPVAAPAFVLLRAPTQGESIESLVIRSNPVPVDDLTKIAPGANATAYAATSVAQTAGFLDHCDRHVAPPKTSQIMAETHGMLDALTAQGAYQVSAKESGTFYDTQVYNVDTGTTDPLPAGELSFIPEPGPTPGDPPASGQLVLHTLSKLTVPYLPDPLADGMAIRFPGTPTPPLDPTLSATATLPYVVDSLGWPRVSASHLVAQESTSASITYSTTPGTFSVGLPPATIVVVRSSTSPTAALLPTSVVGSQIGTMPAAMASALQGGNWLLSPYREVTLVHAVQRPLLIPTLSSYALGRDVGAAFVLPSGYVNVDGRSTVQIDLNAAWTDPVDDPANPAGPQTSDHTGRAFTVTVDYTDTKIAINPVLAGPGAPPQRHELGDTKHRWITYSPDATTRYREYFPASLTSDPTQITTKGVTLIANALASRRPDPLKVLYAVPTFKWDRSTDGSTVTRTGRGVRVYFDRPWYSSGDDELVGVLLAPSGSDPRVTQYTSEWGRDPVWSSTGPTDALGPQHFTNALTTTPQPSSVPSPAPPLSAGPFALAEDSTLGGANVVGFLPEYSKDRNLWFVDIEMDPGDSYFPFVRLALARYQPHAVGAGSSTSQHLSRAVRTEFLQLVPDRTAAISYSGTTLSVTVSGVAGNNAYAVTSGVTPLASPPVGGLVSLGLGRVPSQAIALAVGGGHRVTAQVEKRPAGSANDLLWENDGDEVELSPYPETGYVLWATALPLPGSPNFSESEYRLLVRERERYESDPDTKDGTSGDVPYGERLVYAAALSLKW